MNDSRNTTVITRNSVSLKEVKNGVDNEQQVNWCHHGHLTQTNPLVHCNKCKSNKFCVACIAKWYPDVSEEQFIEACPVCCNNCNCKACLRGLSPKDMNEYSCSEPDKIRYSKDVIRKVNSLVTTLNEEQLAEKFIEASVKGSYTSELQLVDAECDVDEDIYCNYCGAYLLDLYRSCDCGYDLCLRCCQELRECNLHGMSCGWKGCIDGSIPCPPKAVGGCDDGVLELKHIMPVNWVANLLEKARSTYTSFDIPETSMECCTCNAHYLYSLSAKDIEPQDMQHFQLHWSKGEPAIVRDVLSTSSGLSWDPMALWRAFHDTTKSEDHSHAFEVNAVSCLDWSEVDLDLYKFFRGYAEDKSRKLKLEDWQPFSLSDEEWPRHFVEIMRCLPFKDYTHPRYGYLNFAVKLPHLSLKPDMGPRMDIAYGDSVTKLHFNKADTVNILTHTSTKLNKKKTRKRKHGDPMEGGATWDIFRRQELPILEEYLKNHLEQVVYPLHSRAFYLNTKHKRKLKKEFGIEPWTFTQKLGDAIFIPAGCPYQVKNLKSTTKVEFNFISPESLGECIRLQQELRMLPNNHRAKLEKLNIWKMIIYALDRALADLAEPIDDLKLAKLPEILNGNDSDETVGMWQGHAVGLEAKELLQAVEKRYPNTFHGVHIPLETIWMPVFEQFCIVMKLLKETHMDTLTEDDITMLHKDLEELELFGFDLSWAHKRLHMLEKLKYRYDSLQKELKDLEESLEPLNERLVERLQELLSICRGI